MGRASTSTVRNGKHNREEGVDDTFCRNARADLDNHEVFLFSASAELLYFKPWTNNTCFHIRIYLQTRADPRVSPGMPQRAFPASKVVLAGPNPLETQVRVVRAP